MDWDRALGGVGIQDIANFIRGLTGFAFGFEPRVDIDLTAIPGFDSGGIEIFYLGAIFTIDKDTQDLRNQMSERAKGM